MLRIRPSSAPFVVLAALALATIAGPADTAAQQAASSDEEKIAEALSAAPPDVASGATVLDWPAETGADFRVLREGDNGWSCLPDLPGDTNFEPMCNDARWMEWFRAVLAGRDPEVSGMGLSYMLDTRWAVSNTDPTAIGPAPGNQWHEGGAHLMVIVPDPAMLDGFPDDPGADGAYVMWRGTPLVHLMIPTPARASWDDR